MFLYESNDIENTAWYKNAVKATIPAGINEARRCSPILVNETTALFRATTLASTNPAAQQIPRDIHGDSTWKVLGF